MLTNYSDVADSFFLMADLLLGTPCYLCYDLDSSDLHNTSEHQPKVKEGVQMEEIRAHLQAIKESAWCQL